MTRPIWCFSRWSRRSPDRRRDIAPDFELPDQEEAGAVVMGASPDPVAKLLADEDHPVAEAYGVCVDGL